MRYFPHRRVIMNLHWEREPFNGGVSYHSEELAITITALYPYNHFESDASQWIMFVRGNMIKTFDTCVEAQEYAEWLAEI